MKTEPLAPPRPATATLADRLRIAARVGLPAVASGLVARRPRQLALIERFGLDRRAVELLRELRARYGPGPLLLPGRPVALLLSATDAAYVLDRTPDPFTPATREKREALGRFEPAAVLVASDTDRDRLRRLNEEALEPDRALHHLAPRIVGVVRAEAARLSARAGPGDDRAVVLGQRDFDRAWWRVVRRVVLGDAARDDVRLTALLTRLRSAANWGPLAPRRTRTRTEFEHLLDAYTQRAERGSLCALGSGLTGQIPHWLFAFDAAGAATLRALALLATHPAQEEQVRNELAVPDLARPQPLAYTRACVLESLRLWPTTPLLLREGARETRWGTTTLPPGTSYVIHAPYFHRDDANGYADRFVPEIWVDGTASGNPALMPFSRGPARCPGESLVLLVASTFLAALLERHEVRQRAGTRLSPDGPLPYTVNHFALRLELAPY
ncbi:cytochrome P450 [Streptomyces sp. NPDC001941]|uniref:cytochrome P450 n=1 Tax=Streptomyces sp. NPDC001941 TaxID=3154659 RepID=UPI0033193F7D